MLERLSYVFSLVCALAIFAPMGAVDAIAQSQTAVAPGAVEYRLGSGDRVRITVFGEDDLTGDFELDGSGMFSFPLVGTVNAQNQTVRELEGTIADLLLDGFLRNPQVSVEVLNYRPFYIVGEVNEPGSYSYRAGMTVINAVAMAGGFTFRADEDDIEITRRAASQQSLAAGPLTIVMPGDVVKVKERFF